MSFFSSVMGAIERLVHSHREMSMDEVNETLTTLATSKAEAFKEPPLSWQTSVIDLLKLLDLDSSFQARLALAEELGLEGVFIGSREQNEELHDLVMKSVAKRCTPIPKS